MENWVQTSQVVPPSQRKALMELAIFTKCRHVLALLLPPKVCCSALQCVDLSTMSAFPCSLVSCLRKKNVHTFRREPEDVCVHIFSQNMFSRNMFSSKHVLVRSLLRYKSPTLAGFFSMRCRVYVLSRLQHWSTRRRSFAVRHKCTNTHTQTHTHTHTHTRTRHTHNHSHPHIHTHTHTNTHTHTYKYTHSHTNTHSHSICCLLRALLLPKLRRREYKEEGKIEAENDDRAHAEIYHNL